MLDKENTIFLLGGRDLEMVEIKRVLSEENIKYIDHELSWDNANMSAYREEIESCNPHTSLYPIELKQDLHISAHYKVYTIDHHGKYHKNPSALEQVLTLLGKTPTPRQKRIIQNDVGYITAMLCMGASIEEIKEIRQLDQEAQGVTAIDKTRGQNDARAKKVYGDIAVVCATTDKFSTITDSLYFDYPAYKHQKKTIIYNDRKIVFYGFGIQLLQSLCKKYNIDEESYYFGGGDFGYFGLIQDIITTEIREKMIKELTKEKPLYSSHIFMFPFRFDYNQNGFDYKFEFYKECDIKERIDFEKLKESLKTSNWSYEAFDLKKDLKNKKDYMYNEYTYFYDYARDSIYNLSDKEPISYYFENRDFDDNQGTYTIDIRKTSTREAKRFVLDIDGISLRVFKTGIAVLSIELDNHTTGDFDEILQINDFGRRIYPAFVSGCKTDATKGALLAEQIEISGMPTAETFDFIASDDTRVGKHIMYLLGDVFSQDKNVQNKYYIQPSLDDRMFVVSWVGNTNYSKCLDNKRYLENTKWYEYVFVDGDGKTIHSPSMQRKIIQNATYDRWMDSEDGLILFGVTRYSFVVLGDAGWFSKNMISRHTKSMYFQMMHMLLATRASILRFSDEVSALASEDVLDISKLQTTYQRYLTFYNRMYFKEVTHQEQGIELYNMALEQMKIPEHIEKLDGKFTKLHDFANLQAEKRTSKAMNRLTYFGGLFLVPTFVISLFGLKEFQDFMTKPHIAWVGLSAIVGLVIAKIITSKGEN